MVAPLFLLAIAYRTLYGVAGRLRERETRS